MPPNNPAALPPVTRAGSARWLRFVLALWGIALALLALQAFELSLFQLLIG